MRSTSASSIPMRSATARSCSCTSPGSVISAAATSSVSGTTPAAASWAWTASTTRGAAEAASHSSPARARVREPVVRNAGAADRATIQDVTLAAYEEYAARMPPPLWRAYRQNIVETLGQPAPALQLVAEDAGTVVGTVLLYPAGGERRWPEVRLLAVA